MAVAIPIIAGIVGAISTYEAVFMAAVILYGDYQRKKAERASRGLEGVSSVDRTEMIRSSAASRVTLYGQSRISGNITYVKEVSRTDVYILLTLTGHEISAIKDVYLSGEQVAENADGMVIGKYSGHVEVWRGLGTTAGDAALLAKLVAISGGEWTIDHRQTGCGKLLVRLVYDRDLFPAGIPDITAVVLGKPLYDPRAPLGPPTYSDNAALALRDYMVSTDGLGAPATKFSDSAWAAEANVCDEVVTLASGHSSEFTAVRLAPPSLAAHSTREWGSFYRPNSYNLGVPRLGDINVFYFLATAAHRSIRYGVTFTDAVGETTVHLSVNSFPSEQHGDRWRQAARYIALENIPLGTAGTTGRKIYRYDSVLYPNGGLVATIGDNTTTSAVDILFGSGAITPGAAPPSANTTAISAISVASAVYLTTGAPLQLTTTGTLPAPLAIGTTYYWIYLQAGLGRLATTAANATAGIAISLTTDGTGVHSLVIGSERRYTLNGTVTSDVAPRDVIRSMLTACAGESYKPGDKWVLHVGAHTGSSFSIDEDQLDGAITTTPRHGRRALFNAVKGVIFSPEDNWQRTDFPPVTNATYLSEDSGNRIWSDIELPFTISKAAAQRIAKIKLEECRQQITSRWPCKLSMLGVRVGDVGSVTLSRYGWTNKLMKVADFQLAARTDRNGVPYWGVDLVLREYSAAAYSWSSGEETVIDPAPDTALLSAFARPSAPTNLVLTASADVLPDGTLVSGISVVWDVSDSAYVRSGGTVEVAYKLGDSVTEGAPPAGDPSSVWTVITLPGYATETTIQGLITGMPYVITVRFVNSAGVGSNETAGWGIAGGDETAPANVVGLSFTTPLLSWTENTDYDLMGYRVRWQYPTDPNLGWQYAASAHAAGFITETQFDMLRLLLLDGDSVIVYVKAVDFSGNESATAAQLTVTVTDIQLHTLLASNWTIRTVPKAYVLNSVAWNGSVFCAVGGADGTDAYILISTDGVTWTESSNPKNIALWSIAWNGSVFCAVGSVDGSTDAYIVTSPDGVTWTERSNPKNRHLLGIAWNGSIFCAVGSNESGADTYIITSSDGVTWTERNAPANYWLSDIVWNGTIFCAVGYIASTDAYVLTSSDGITWEQRSNPNASDLFGIAWNGSVFCAVGAADGTDAYIITSTDGITWTERQNPLSVGLRGVSWNGSIFCAVGYTDGIDTALVTSPDGITWTERASPKSAAAYDIVWNGKFFVSVGSNGTVLTSLSMP